MATASRESMHELLTVSLPKEIVEDLNKIASFKDTNVENLVYSYITEGVSNDSLAARRKEFTDKANEILGKDKPPKKKEEIFDELVF